MKVGRKENKRVSKKRPRFGGELNPATEQRIQRDTCALLGEMGESVRKGVYKARSGVSQGKNDFRQPIHYAKRIGGRLSGRA